MTCVASTEVCKGTCPSWRIAKRKREIQWENYVDFHSRHYTTKWYPMPETTFNIDLQTLWGDPMSTYVTNFWKHLSGDVEWFLFVANRDHPSSTAHHASYQGSQAFPESKDRSQHANKLILMIEEIPTLGIPSISHSSFTQVTSYTRLLSSCHLGFQNLWISGWN